MPSHAGACFCGAVTLECTGEPLAMGYCHCRDCRSWSAGPLNAYTIWRADQVRITGGADQLGGFSRNGRTNRRFCRRCGGLVLAELTASGLVDVFAATIPDLPFVPAMHINYAETVLPMRDGLPKFKEFPAQAGGSGETIPE